MSQPMQQDVTEPEVERALEPPAKKQKEEDIVCMNACPHTANASITDSGIRAHLEELMTVCDGRTAKGLPHNPIPRGSRHGSCSS